MTFPATGTEHPEIATSHQADIDKSKQKYNTEPHKNLNNHTTKLNIILYT